jgi:hypothetical protein
MMISSAGELLVPEDIIPPVVSDRNTDYWGDDILGD